MSQRGGENMKKITVVVIVVLVCALLLGVGGVALLGGEDAEIFDEVPPPIMGEELSTVVSFMCPVNNPNC